MTAALTAQAAAALHRRRLLQGACALLALAAGTARAGTATEEGPALHPWRPAPRPQMQVQTLDGQSRTLADFTGRPLLVNLWASWCAPCRVEMPSLNALMQQLAPQGWAFIALNHGEMPERARRFLQEVPITGTVLLDRSQATLSAWGAQALPATFVFDAQGRPQLWAQGERDWAAPEVLAALRALR